MKYFIEKCRNWSYADDGNRMDFTLRIEGQGRSSHNASYANVPYQSWLQRIFPDFDPSDQTDLVLGLIEKLSPQQVETVTAALVARRLNPSE